MQPCFFKNSGPIDVKTIKNNIDCETINLTDDTAFAGLTSINKLKKNEISFLSDIELSRNHYYPDGTVICTNKAQKKFKAKNALIIVHDVQTAVSKLSNLFYRSFTSDEIKLLDSPKINSGCRISSSAIIENGSKIGKNVNIGHGCVIGYNSIIGDNSIVDANTVITNSIIGENVKIGRNVSIGQQGFGFSINKNEYTRIFHIGRVILQSGVNIGSGCTFDRGSFSDTSIGQNTFFDNLCHVAHNVEIGTNCIFAGMTGVAGSTKIGNNVMTGGQVGISGHLTIGDNVKIAAQSGVLKDIHSNESVMGNPAINKHKYIKKYIKNYG